MLMVHVTEESLDVYKMSIKMWKHTQCQKSNKVFSSFIYSCQHCCYAKNIWDFSAIYLKYSAMLKVFIKKYVLQKVWQMHFWICFRILKTDNMWCVKLMNCIAAWVADSVCYFNQVFKLKWICIFLISNCVVFILISRLKSFTFVEVF